MVTLSGATTVTTNGTGAFGLGAYGLYASNGGTIDALKAPSVTVTTYPREVMRRALARPHHRWAGRSRFAPGLRLI